MNQPRKPSANSKIIVDDQETKNKIIFISGNTNENMKAIIKRLIDVEYEKVRMDNEPI